MERNASSSPRMPASQTADCDAPPWAGCSALSSASGRRPGARGTTSAMGGTKNLAQQPHQNISGLVADHTVWHICPPDQGLFPMALPMEEGISNDLNVTDALMQPP